jgi:hypothetical protein
VIVIVEQAIAMDTRPSRALVRRQARPAALLMPFLLSLASLSIAVLAMAGVEGLARWYAPDYLVRTRGFHVFSDTYGWVPRAGTSVVIDGKRVGFNAAGYRGRELALPKARDRTRVIVLGDSIAFGLDVSDDETFTHLIDAHDNRIEAGNLAVQGYGPDQELLVLMNEGLHLDPDVVVLAFCLGNDLVDTMLPVSLYDGRSPKPRFELVDDRLVLDHSNLRQSAWRRGQQWLSDYSHLFNRVLALDPGPGASPEAPWRDRKREGLQDKEYALRLNLAIVRRMDAACRERGITFILAAFPHELSYESKPWLAERFLESAQAEGITVVDMAARFMALGQPFSAISLDGVGHLRPVGHVIASRVLEREIAEHAYTPAATTANRPPERRPDLNDRTVPRSPRSGAAAR